VADGSCLQACPVNVFQWYRIDNDVPATQMVSATNYGIGRHGKEDRLDSTDKSDPIMEHECI